MDVVVESGGAGAGGSQELGVGFGVGLGVNDSHNGQENSLKRLKKNWSKLNFSNVLKVPNLQWSS